VRTLDQAARQQPLRSDFKRALRLNNESKARALALSLNAQRIAGDITRLVAAHGPVSRAKPSGACRGSAPGPGRTAMI